MILLNSEERLRQSVMLLDLGRGVEGATGGGRWQQRWLLDLCAIGLEEGAIDVEACDQTWEREGKEEKKTRVYSIPVCGGNKRYPPLRWESNPHELGNLIPREFFIPENSNNHYAKCKNFRWEFRIPESIPTYQTHPKDKDNWIYTSVERYKRKVLAIN